MGETESLRHFRRAMTLVNELATAPAGRPLSPAAHALLDEMLTAPDPHAAVAALAAVGGHLASVVTSLTGQAPLADVGWAATLNAVGAGASRSGALSGSPVT